MLHTHIQTEISKSARLEARVSNEQKDLFQRAATLQGRSLSDFVIQSTQEAALKVVQEHDIIRLNEEERQAFVAALLNPPAPSARLQAAATRYKKKMGM